MLLQNNTWSGHKNSTKLIVLCIELHCVEIFLNEGNQNEVGALAGTKGGMSTKKKGALCMIFAIYASLNVIWDEHPAFVGEGHQSHNLCPDFNIST